METWVSARFGAALTGSPLPFPSPSAHPSVWPFASSLWMLCFPSDLWFPVGSEECEAGAAFCFVTCEQKGKWRLAATGLGFRGGLQADGRASGRSRATPWWWARGWLPCSSGEGSEPQSRLNSLQPLSSFSKSTDPGLCRQTQRAAIPFSVQMIFILDSLNVQKPSAK